MELRRRYRKDGGSGPGMWPARGWEVCAEERGQLEMVASGGVSLRSAEQLSELCASRDDLEKCRRWFPLRAPPPPPPIPALQGSVEAQRFLYANSSSRPMGNSPPTMRRSPSPPV